MGLLLNRAKANTGTTGTGSVTPGSGVVPYAPWATAGAVSGNWYDYLIEDGVDWEVGVGLYDGTTISRPGPGVDPWFESSTNALLNLSGSATIACVANKDTIMADSAFMPPLPSKFPSTVTYAAPAPLITTSRKSGMLFNFNGGCVTGDKGKCAYKSITAPGDWQLIGRIRPTVPPSNWVYGGVMVGRLATRITLFGFITAGANMSILNMNAAMSANAGGAPVAADLISTVYRATWYRISYTSATGTLAFDASMDGDNWFIGSSTTTTALGYGGAPDIVGLAMGTNLNFAAFVPRMNVPFWWDNA